MIKEAEDQVRIIRERLKTTQSHQKSYYDRHHQDVSYEIGEKAYLWVTPLKGVHRFGIKGKLAHRYVGPFLSLLSVESLPISWNFLQHFRMFMMCSMCLNSSVASKIQFMELIIPHLISRKISPTESILFLFLMKLKEKLEVEPSSSSKFNGLIILHKKQLENERIIFDLSTLPFSLVLRNLGMRFL
jgi:hypothetical protein